MDLLLIRHGQAERVELDPAGADPSLSPLGQEQAAGMAEYLAAEQIDKIWSSPMRRALETAQALADLTGAAIETDDRLEEFDRGDTSYLPPDPGSVTPEQVKLYTTKIMADDFVSRVSEAADSIVAASGPTDVVAVTCHAGVIMHAIAHLSGLPQLVMMIRADYSSITRLRIGGGRVRLHSVNEAPWLREWLLATQAGLSSKLVE